MRFAIATDDGTSISEHTGRCRGFMIYEAADGRARKLEHRPNTGAAHASGECAHGQQEAHADRHASGGHSHAPLLDALSDCRALVTRGLGPRLIADLKDNGISVFVCNASDVVEAADLLAKEQLPVGDGCGACRQGSTDLVAV